MVKKMENMALVPLPISLIKLLVKAQHQGGIPYSFRNYLEATMCLILCQALEWFCEYETIAVFKNVPSIGHKENIRHEPTLAQNLQRRGSSGRAKGIEMEPWVAQAGNYCSWCRTGTRLGWVLLFISVILVILSLGIWGIFFFFLRKFLTCIWWIKKSARPRDQRTLCLITNKTMTTAPYPNVYFGKVIRTLRALIIW